MSLSSARSSWNLDGRLHFADTATRPEWQSNLGAGDASGCLIERTAQKWLASLASLLIYNQTAARIDEMGSPRRRDDAVGVCPVRWGRREETKKKDDGGIMDFYGVG